MRFRRRRFKPRVQWLNQPGTLYQHNSQGTTGDSLSNWSGIEFFQDINPGRDPLTIIAPLVQDVPVSDDILNTSFTAWQRSTLTENNEMGYRLRRIVGSMYIAIANQSPVGVNPMPAVLCDFGIIVRRVDSDGQAAVDGFDQDISSIKNNGDPWVLKKDWVLSTGVGAQDPNVLDDALAAGYPRSTAAYFNAQYKIDQKTARIIGREERLFANWTFWQLPINDGATLRTSGFGISVHFPYRVLGSKKLDVGNRRNASR